MAEAKAAYQETFRQFLERLPEAANIVILCHSDADGLAAGALLFKTLPKLGYLVSVRLIGKGESAWSSNTRELLYESDEEGIIVADLGSREHSIQPGIPLLVIDHHRPQGVAPGAFIISGYGQKPTPTSGLLAHWCGETITSLDSLLWITAVSLIGDIGDKAPFEELAQAKKQWKGTVLRELTSLINAARRSGTGNAIPAFDLLLKAKNPADALSGKYPELEKLRAAREEVTAALNVAKKAAPKFSGKVALIRMHSPCQIHPLIAQIWRTRLKDYIVMGVNTGYRPGYVHFSARCPVSVNLIDFLRANAPGEVDEGYGGGHDQASGGALTYAKWNEFVSKLGFGSEMKVVMGQTK
ncbi:MAG: Phosphoesterase [Verrucomicrobiales bacterium]|nr:Phosphoesterase [Verrucomicrobiales bacterium]